MSDARFGIYTILLKPDDNAGNNISIASIDDCSFSPNSAKSPYRAGGSLDLNHVGMVSGSPVYQFGTPDCLTVLGNISPATGLSLTEGFLAAEQKRAAESTYLAAASSGHILHTVAKAFACVDQFDVSQDDDAGAKCNVSLYPLSSNGLVVPVTRAAGVITALPSPAYVSRFFMGPVAIDSTALTGVTGYTVMYGKNYMPKRFNGDVFAKCGSIVSRNPSIRFRTDSGNIDAALNVFTNQMSGNIELWAIKEGDTSNNRVASGTGSHIKHTATGEWSIDESSVSGDADVGYSYTVNVTGTLSVSTTATI